MNISDNPIKTDDKKTLSLERFYAEFNKILESIVEDDASRDARKRESERCVSLCRTAVGAFTYQVQFREVRKVVAHFNNFAGIIIEAGVFASAQEFNILTYGPGVEDKDQVHAEKARLSKDFLPRLYSKNMPALPEHRKYGRAAMFQEIKGMADFYCGRYGYWSDEGLEEKGGRC